MSRRGSGPGWKRTSAKLSIAARNARHHQGFHSKCFRLRQPGTLSLKCVVFSPRWTKNDTLAVAHYQLVLPPNQPLGQGAQIGQRGGVAVRGLQRSQRLLVIERRDA